MANGADAFSAPAFPCRHCGTPVSHPFVDLGMTPLCETRIAAEDFNAPERFYPLQAYVCGNCLLVQLRDCVSAADVFTHDYPYFSSYSSTWVRHAKDYVERIVPLLGLSENSLVIEVASNDGYLLQHFGRHRVPVLGVEPCRSVAEAARLLGIRTEIEFFGSDAARRLRRRFGAADLIIGNNVLAHVPDINDFLAGLREGLADRGIITLEFPHLLNLIRHNQFDTIYHEHFSYLSLHAVIAVLATAALEVFDVEQLATHGGSLRVYAQHAGGGRQPSMAVDRVLRDEREAGLTRPATYAGFAERVRLAKRRILSFLIEARSSGKRIGGYGAPGKGNTLLNYCGIGTDLLEFTVDANPGKHYHFTPGSRIPIFPPDHIRTARPDYLVILPWNLRSEIMAQTRHIQAWGGRWVTLIPEPTVWTGCELTEACEP